MPSYSEQEIIEGCRRSDRTFQEHLYKEYYSVFLKVCARYARDMQDAELLLNDGFLKIFLNINSYKNKGSFAGWMRRVVVNACLDHLRSNYLKDTMIMHVNAMPVSSKTSVNNTGLENIEFKELLELIQCLPVMTRTVFNLFVFEGFNHKEISKQLEISEKTSHWHVHQAREVLQKKLKKNESQKVMYESKRI